MLAGGRLASVVGWGVRGRPSWAALGRSRPRACGAHVGESEKEGRRAEWAAEWVGASWPGVGEGRKGEGRLLGRQQAETEKGRKKRAGLVLRLG